MTEAEQRISTNNYFIGRREVMFQALKDYHSQSHDGQTEEQKIAALNTAIDRAAANNGRLSEQDRAKVALEWRGVIANKPAAQIIAFAEDAGTKRMVSGELPQIPATYDFGTDLNTVNVNNGDALRVVGRQYFADVMAGRQVPPMSDMQTLADMNKLFEETAQRHNLVDYANGGSLSATLNERTTTDEAQIRQQQERMRPLVRQPEQPAAQPQGQQPQNQPQNQPQQPQQQQQQGGGLGGMLSTLLGGLGDMGQMLLGLLSAFMGGGQRRQGAQPPANALATPNNGQNNNVGQVGQQNAPAVVAFNQSLTGNQQPVTTGGPQHGLNAGVVQSSPMRLS